MRPFALPRSRHARLCAGAALSAALAWPAPVLALAAKDPTGPAHGVAHTTVPSFPIPASARVQGNTGQITTGTSPKTTPTMPPPTTSIPASARIHSASPPASATSAPGQSALRSTLPRNGPPGARPNGATGSGLHLSRGAWIAAAIAALLVLLSAAWALVRWLALEPRWTRSLAYSLEETSFRASATWSEFLDWARLGR